MTENHIAPRTEEATSEPEIPWSAHESLASWRRILEQSDGDRRGLFERAAVELLRVAEQLGGEARQVIVDELFGMARAVGIGGDETQVILNRASEARPDVVEQGRTPPEFSQEQIALRYAEMHSGSRRHVALWSKWLVWDGTHWRVDETQRTRESVRILCREVSHRCLETTNKPGLARTIASKPVVEGVERLASSDSRIAVHPDQLDADHWVLNTPGGIFDLRGARVRPHCPDDHCSKITSVAPNADCSIATWLRFLDRAAGGNIELIGFLKRMAGYALTGSTREHALFFLYGTGANGKSTFLNAITGYAGDYHRTAAIETFTASVNERHPTDLAALRGARIVTAVETEEGRRWAESKIKSLTGGDRIAARFMRQDFFEFTPTFKLILCGNHTPSLRSIDEAIRRRFHLIPFTITIPPTERDLALGDKLRAEWPGILNWAIEGCLEWQQRGLDPPDVIKQATANYLEAEDTLSAWLEEAGFRDPKQWEYTEELFASWRRFATKSGEHVGSLTKFSQRLQDRSESLGLRKDRDRGGRRGFWGFKLFTPAPPGRDDRVEP